LLDTPDHDYILRMTPHSRNLLPRALWLLALLLHVGVAVGTSTQHDDELWGSGLSSLAAPETGEAPQEDRRGHPPGPDPDFDCVLCVAAHLQVLPQTGMEVEALSSFRAAFLLPESDRVADGRPVLARHARGPPPA
jgi:hypothetical protein